MKKYNTPHRHRVIKTRLTEEEYAEVSERVSLCKMSQAEFIRQALTKSRIQPVITVSLVNDELLSAVGKLTAEYGKIGGNLTQIALCLNEYGAPYNALSQEARAALSGLAALKLEVLQKVGEAVGNTDQEIGILEAIEEIVSGADYHTMAIILPSILFCFTIPLPHRIHL